MNLGSLVKRTVALRVTHGWRIVIFEVEVRRLWAIVVRIARIAGSTSGVDLGSSVVSPGCVVSLGTIIVPGKGRVFEIPGILDHLTAALVRVVDTPRTITRSAQGIEAGSEEAY